MTPKTDRPSFAAIVPAATWPASFTYSPGVVSGRLVVLSGTTATDDHGKLVGVGDIVEQTRQIFRKFDRILRQAGGSARNIVETTDYIVTTEGYATTADVRREFFGGPPWPAATGVIVAGLLRPGALIEIKGLAILPE